MHPYLSTPRCFADFDETQSGDLQLSPEEGRHLTRVRRVGTGSRICVLNGRGCVASGTVQHVERHEVWLTISKVETYPEPTPELTLVTGALKQAAWDGLLKQAVELGVNRIIRVQCERSVSELKSGKEDIKLQRWAGCLVEGCKQSGNPWIPELEVAGTIESAVTMVSNAEMQLLASLEGEVTPLSKQLSDPLPSRIAIWVGPEGDFTLQEQEMIRSGGGTAISLGDRILRAETAALALISALRLRP
jgi:16S rRNA (uracil1498-N3)-methyltransferase